MKRILYIISAFAALTFAGCQKEDDKEASVQLTPESAVAEYLSGKSETTVISSGEWTMEGNYTWITPSARSGKSGDKVTFTYILNTTGKDRGALFKIRCGSAYANYTLKQESGNIEMNAAIELVSASEGVATLSMTVESPKDINKFVTWGVRYSTSEETLIEEGKDVAIEGTPKEGEVQVSVTDLENDVNYYFAGYLDMSDGTRIYTDNVVKVFIASAFESEVTVSGLTARNATFSYEVNIPALVETGVCFNTKGEPTIDDDYINDETEEVIVGLKPELNAFNRGWILDPSTTYYIRAYAKRENGEVAYGPVKEFKTMSDPFDNWISDDSYKSDYSHFQSLSEYGPIKDASWDSKQYITEAASATQANFRQYWNTALTSYSETAKYAALFSELALLKKADGSIVMQNLVWREGTVGEGDPKEANRVGGFAYKVKENGGFFDFEPDNYAYSIDGTWAIENQGMSVDEIATIWQGASNVSELSKIKTYWASHTFFLDWGETKTFDGQSYSEILLYAEDDLDEVFRFNAACFGTNKYDAESHTYEPPVWRIWVVDGTSETNYELEELSTGGYYLRLDSSLAGKSVRISSASTGYPAYVPTADGKAQQIDDASGAYVVPVANKDANKCAISFSAGANICIVKDICVLSDTCFPCGDQIDWGGSVGNWDADGAYRYCRNNCGFFAPTDKLREPHIYRFNTTFKTGGNEGFKIPMTNNFTKGGYNSKVTVPDNNPIDTWIDVVVETGDSSTGSNDYKWKPDTTGDYTIELDLNAMKLRAVKR